MSDLLFGIMIGSALGAFLGVIALATMQALVRRDERVDALNAHYKEQE